VKKKLKKRIHKEERYQCTTLTTQSTPEKQVKAWLVQLKTNIR